MNRASFADCRGAVGNHRCQPLFELKLLCQARRRRGYAWVHLHRENSSKRLAIGGETRCVLAGNGKRSQRCARCVVRDRGDRIAVARSEEHTSELQSHVNLVCRLLLEKKKKKK